jgi:hypothetical protein
MSNDCGSNPIMTQTVAEQETENPGPHWCFWVAILIHSFSDS